MVDSFPKGISLEVNVRARLKFKLVYLDTAVQQFSHYIT